MTITSELLPCEYQLVRKINAFLLKAQRPCNVSVTMVSVSLWVPNAYAVHMFKSQFDPHENSLNSAKFGVVGLHGIALLMSQELGLQ